MTGTAGAEAAAGGGNVAGGWLTEARVLIVDDNRINRHLLSALLEREGIQYVQHALDGLDGLNKLEGFPADLVLLDLMMPNMDGFEMCRRMRRDPRWADVPVLVQSSLTRAEDRGRAFTAGATDYVSKPLNAGELIARARIHLEKRALLRELDAFHRKAAAELSLAWRMQERLLPGAARLAQLRERRGLSAWARFIPSSELGGDVWDFRDDGADGVTLFVADFSGHGVGAALNTFRLHAVARRVGAAASPADFLEKINQRLTGLLPFGQFATMLAGAFRPETDQFVYASAGSTRPMVWLPGGDEPIMGDSDGLPLGLTGKAVYDERALPFPPGARLFLYSDAAIEIATGGDVLDHDGLARLAAARLARDDDDGFLDGLIDDLRAVGEIDDDLTAVLIRRDV